MFSFIERKNLVENLLPDTRDLLLGFRISHIGTSSILSKLITRFPHSGTNQLNYYEIIHFGHLNFLTRPLPKISSERKKKFP